MTTRRKTKARSVGELRPYYEETRGGASPDWRAMLARLVGFDIEDLRARMSAWMFEHGFERRIDGHFAGLTFDPQAVTKGSPKRNRQGAAIFHVSVRLMHLENMWGAERLAWMRWRETLDELEAALRRAEPFARVRVREDSFFLGRCAGETARRNQGARLVASTRVRDGIHRLLPRLIAARRSIPRYRDDILPGVESAGRWSKGYLASLEAELHDGGFPYAEIAKFTEQGPGAAQRVRQRVERFRKASPGSEKG